MADQKALKNIRKRVKFARAHLDWTPEQWREVLWSDESPFVFRYAARKRVWKIAGEYNHKSLFKGTVKHDKKIMVWGCFAYHGVGRLHCIKTIMDQKIYKQILMRQMLPSARQLFPNRIFTFQQDNDPKHTSHSSRNYLVNKNITLMEWPAQSLDLNPIENLWSILDKQTRERRPQTEEELFEILQNGWNNIPITKLNALVDSMPRRCAAVMKSKGLPTKY
jgi:hypothetical protein